MQRTRLYLGLDTNSPSTDLKAEVKRLMFSADKEPLVVTTDPGKFTMIMSAFTTYEKQVKPDSSHSGMSDMLKKLKTHTTETFPQDFPFYLLLSYRLHLMYSVYDCDELKTFIPLCITRFEGMDPKSIARVMINFTDKGDFKVIFPGSEAEFTAGVFFLLESACKELANVSHKIQMRMISDGQLYTGARSLYSGFVYSRMLWISTALKFHEKRSTTVSRSTTAIWQEHLLQFSSRVKLDMQTIFEFKRGLEFSRLLKLPTDLTFNYPRMAEFIVAGKRPLSHVESFLRTVESYIMFEHDLADFLANIRDSYNVWLREGGIAKLTNASVQGTLAGAISEGISLVDCISDICSRRKVDHILVEAESIKWLLLLLQLIDFTDSRAETHLRQFLQNRGPVLKSMKYQQEIRKYIRETTKVNFPRLTIQQFGSLFKAFKIYPVKMVEEFLGFYEIRQGMKINNPTWQTFISEIVSRFGGARKHYFLLDFLKNVSHSYLYEVRQNEFVVDLLQLKVPKLFAMEEGSDEMAEKEDFEVARRFTIFLRSYINRLALKQSLLAQMSVLLASISEERDDFQQLILSVLQKEIIPEFKVLQAIGTGMGTGAGGVQSNFQSVLEGAVTTLARDLTWLKELTTKQKFYWGLVAACCSKINIGHENFNWVHSYDKVLKKVGHIFTVYCSGRRLMEHQCIIIKQLPEEVAKHPVEDIKKYFEWVREIQLVMKEWQDRFLHQRANYDEILLYISNHTYLLSLGHTLCITSLVCDAQDLHQMKSDFLYEFEALNISLLKYIPEQPDTKWCTLPALLQEYGVSLPRKLRDMIFRYVCFPGEPNRHNWDPPTHPVPPSTTGRFQLGHEISLELAKDVGLYQLAELITELNHFQQPLLAHLQMLVFFKLNKSVMFDKYLRVQIGHNTEKFQQQKTQSLAQSPQFSGFQFSIPLLTSILPPTSSVAGREEEEEGLPMKIFIRSLEGTKELLSKVMNGNAKYSEIIAKGALDLENLDIDKEFEVLNNYSILSRLTCSGLTGVRSILELFQYSTHIHNIQAVCDQYKLKGCLADSKLTILKDLVGELGSEEARAKLTPNEASEKLKKVKETLGVTEKTNSKCLDLFAVIQDSVIFYQFVRDKQFYGENGNALFYQQYQLITALLQHEEQVLNHVFAAFKLMAPFMDSRQDLGTLMSKVLALDMTNGLRQLETVNANITPIRLWFSRVEGDTLENVAKELDSIIQTGYYIFTLSRDASTGGLSAQIMLEYIPSTAAAPQPQQVFTTSGHHSQPHSSGPSSDRLPLSFEMEGGEASDNGPRMFPCMLSKMESQGGNELYGTGIATTAASMRPTNFEHWNTEQIGDFVRKLGFLDKEKDKGEGYKIKHFLHVNEVAYKLLELYIKLRELGHVQYINEGNIGPTLSCQFTTEDIEERVRETEVILTTWTHKVANICKEFSWLLFFSLPKLLRLYRLLSEELENMVVHLKRIVHEISFLCVNNAEARKRMKTKVQRAHEFCKSTMEENEVPVKIVGTFLNSLFENHSLPHRCHPSSPLLRPRSITESLSLVQEFTQLLHFCPGYTQDNLIRVIIGLYSGVPESFEVFHCRSNTTEGELNLFLKRAAKFPLQYLILEVNKLPYKLQEHLRLLVQQEFQGLQHHLSLRCTPSTEESVDISSPTATAPVIHFVETAPSVLREMPWIQLKEHKQPKLSYEDAREICVKTIVNSADFSCVQLVYGFAGAGKTHYIKSQLEQMDESIIIDINKTFTPLKAILKLCSLPLEKDCGIFFNFTMFPPGDMVDEKERERYHQLMDLIGWFFFDLFILGYVEDPNTGKSFRLPGGLKWAVYIEVPCRKHDMSPSEALKQFCCKVPVLGLIGTQCMIPRDKPYSFDKDMQLVCKYLRALSTGGTKDIDKLYGEGGLLAKFSREPDLTEDECQTLLQNYMYMSEHVQKTNQDNQYLQEKLAQYELQFKQFTEEKAKAQERLDYLEIENKVLLKNKKIASEAKESLQQENCTLRQEMQILQQKLSLLQSENDQYRLSQQESIAFGLQPWKIARERIKIGKLIGGGGWGAVLEGDLKVAVKQFYPGIISSQNLARIRREMEMLARIRHPNLLQFIGVVFEDDENADVYANPPYILTELLDTSLREAYEKGQVSEENLYPIFQDTARALDYLHRRHEPIVHRDVSSANVLLKRLPNGMWMAKVSDLGSANLAKDSFTKNEGAIIYCAPEAFTDKSNTRSETLLTPKIDVYSYGIMLCEVVNRMLPDQDKIQLLLEQSKDKQPELHSQIIIKCVNEEPKERPSMKDVLSALDKLSSPKLHATSK